MEERIVLVKTNLGNQPNARINNIHLHKMNKIHARINNITTLILKKWNLIKLNFIKPACMMRFASTYKP